MIYNYTIKDSPSGFWMLDESLGQTAQDSSGCENNGTYFGSINKSSMPMTSGGTHSLKIDSSNYIEFDVHKDLYGQSNNGGVLVNGTEDNDFSLEVWFHPKTLVSETRILSEINDICGLYYDKGNIVFKLGDSQIYYSVPDKDRALHVVGTYAVNSINLFLDGKRVASSSINITSFNNTNLLTLGCGPTNLAEYYLIDYAAIYRYALNQEQILNHYLGSLTGSEIEIVSPEGGELFKITDRHQNITEKYIYPVQKSWEYFVNDNLLYSSETNSIYLNSSSNSGEFKEIISLVYWKQFISSRIEWSATEGVSVFVSLDESNWQECTNGKELPGFSVSDFSEEKIIHIKVVFSSSDSSVYIPELYYLGIDFYTEKKIFSHNSPAILSTDQSWNINFGSIDNNVLHRYANTGVTTDSSGFYVETDRDTNYIEFILTPSSVLNGYLIYNKTDSIEHSLEISGSGDISKSNISNLYINGIDISADTNISSYVYENEPNYILAKFTNSITGKIWLNAKFDDGLKTGVLPDNTYNNISLYEASNIDHYKHYNMYIGKEITSVEDSSIELTEEVVKTYSRDRVLLNNL